MAGIKKNDYRQEIIEIARDLRYPEDVIQKLRVAKNAEEIERIMHTARTQERKG